MVPGGSSSTANADAVSASGPAFDVSVVIPTYRGAHRMPVILEALQRQSTRVTYEIVVAVDGDVDGTADAIAALDLDGPAELTVVVLEQNQGRPAALNAGFASARGGILIRCDDDLVPASDFVQRHHDHHDQPDVAVIGLYRNVMEDNAYWRAWGRDASERFNEAARRTPPEDRWRLWAGNCSVSRSLFDKVGPYDETFRSYGFEDADWGYRAASIGGRFVIDDGLETEHRVPSTTTAERSARAFLSGSASVRFTNKHGSVIPEQPSSLRASAVVWSLLVWLGSFASDVDRARRRGGRIDLTLDRLPRAIGRRLVGWSIEASARSGVRRGPSDG